MDRDIVDRVFYTLAFVLALCLTALVVALTIDAVQYILEGGLR
jgi:hypothetical protein